MPHVNRRLVLKSLSGVIAANVILDRGDNVIAEDSKDVRNHRYRPNLDPEKLKKNGASIKIDLNNLREAPVAEERQVYWVLLTNLSDWTVTHSSVDGTNFYPIVPPVSRNCSSSCNQCFDEGKYDPVLATDCTAAPFNLWIKAQKGNQVGIAGPASIRPTCTSAGEVVCLHV